MKKPIIHKLIKKEHLGYRCSTIDMILFETDNKKGLLTIDNMQSEIVLDMTDHTIETLYEFFRYLKEDKDDRQNES